MWVHAPYLLSLQIPSSDIVYLSAKNELFSTLYIFKTLCTVTVCGKKLYKRNAHICIISTSHNITSLFCFHPLCPDGFGSKSLSGLYLRNHKVKEVDTLVRGCRRAMSWCDLDLTSDLAKVTLIYKILPGLYARNC